jgi:PAS domain S-box-containing protein
MVDDDRHRFQTFAEELRLPACSITGGRVTYVSPGLADLLGFTAPEERWMADVERLLNAPELERLSTLLVDGEADRDARQSRLVHALRRDGSPMELEIQGVPVRAGAITHCVVREATGQEEAADAVRVAEARLSQLSENIHEVLWIAAPGGETIEYVSPAFARTWGFCADRLREEPELWLQSVCPEDRDRVRKALREPGFDIEYRIVRPDGEERWIRNRSIPPARDATPGSIAGVAEDITAKKVTEKSLRKRDRYYRSLIQNASDIISVVGPDLQVRFLSPAVARVLGYDDDSPRPRNALEWIHPADLAHVKAVVQRIVQEPADPQVIQFRLRHNDGSWRVHEAIGSAFHEEGEGISVIVNSRDITDRNAAETELRESQARFDLAARATTDVIWDWDFSSGRITWSDMVSSVFDYEPAEIQPTFGWWEQQIHPDDRARVTESILAITQAGQFWTQEYRFRRGDRSYATVIHRAYVIRTEGGQPARFVGAMADFTERKQLQEQLYQSQRLEAIGRLAGGVAHDFNNILMVIQGAASLALFDLPDDSPVRSDLSDIQRATERAKTLTKQLLAFGRRQVLTPKVVSLNESISELEKMLGRLLGEDIALTVRLAPDLWPAEVDPIQFEQVIINLAVNARDAMPQGGALHIKTDNVRLTPEDTERFTYRVKPGSYARVTVRDTGCGMDQAMISQAFEPFFTTKEDGKGTGLGLSTVYGIIKQSGGYIWVDSVVGRGATFRIYLPRATGELTRAPVPQKLQPTPRGSGTVLLVEDEYDVRAVARRILERNGYSVLEASNGAEALETFEASGRVIDLLVTDVVMPGMSGRELANSIASACPTVRVLYMSGHTDDRILHHGIGHAGLNFVQKPFSPEAFLHRIHEIRHSPPAEL